MDLNLWKHIALRVFEADYQYAHQNFANSAPTDQYSLRHATYDGALLRTGLVFSFGGAPELLVGAACSVQNPDVMVGEPVHATVVASNFNPKHTLTYTWASNGGKIEGKDTGATIDTTGVSGGSYTTTATVTDPRPGRTHGQLHRQLYREGATEEPAADFLFGEPVDGPSRHFVNHYLRLHQSG